MAVRPCSCRLSRYRLATSLSCAAVSPVPVDGEITEGSAYLDESAITGESMPVEKHVGDTVIGATVSKSGYVVMKALRVGDDTTLSQIIRLVEEAGASKAPIAKLADKVAGVFVPVVMGIALVTAIIWLLAGETPSFALTRAISVLVISCPCALGLATPVCYHGRHRCRCEKRRAVPVGGGARESAQRKRSYYG